MYGGELIFVIVGIVLLIINICMIVKFFQIASNVEKLTKLYVDGVNEVKDDKLDGWNTAKRYYKLPLQEMSEDEKEKEYDEFIKATNKKREEYAIKELKDTQITQPY